MKSIAVILAMSAVFNSVILIYLTIRTEILLNRVLPGMVELHELVSTRLDQIAGILLEMEPSDPPKRQAS